MAGLIKFIESVCVQDAVYWGPGTNGTYGKVFPAPVWVKVRWDDMSEVMTANDGRQFVSNAKILSPEEMSYEGWLKLADPETYTPPAKPIGVAGAWEIKRVQTTPLFKSKTESVREYFT